LNILIIFFITWHLTEDYFPAFLSSLVFTLIPHNLIWANTASSEPSASLLIGLVILIFIVFLKTQKYKHLFLLMAIIPMACQMRPESVLLLFWLFLGFLVLSPRLLVKRQVWGVSLLTSVFLMPHLLHIYATGGQSWGAEGPKFSLEFFWQNIGTNTLYYLNNKEFPVLFTVLSFVGLLFSRYSLKWKGMILLWFLIFWGIFLFFYAGSYKYGADVRFSLMSFMPLTVFAGMGGGFIKNKVNDLFKRCNTGLSCHVSGILIIVVIFASIEFFPLIRQVGQEAWGARYDHKYAREFIDKIPRRSIVLTHNPTMFLLWGQGAIQAYTAIHNQDLVEYLMDKYNGNVYFHYNYWCNTKSERNIRLCNAIKERYALEEIARAKEQNYEYGLYRMNLK
jgi:hypothetical protein